LHSKDINNNNKTKQKMLLFQLAEQTQLTGDQFAHIHNTLTRLPGTLAIDDIRDAYGCTLLMKAARNNLPALVVMLRAHGARVETRDGLGRTALYYATKHGNRTIADSLVRQPDNCHLCAFTCSTCWIHQAEKCCRECGSGLCGTCATTPTDEASSVHCGPCHMDIQNLGNNLVNDLENDLLVE
jgi:hypothetical protein